METIKVSNWQGKLGACLAPRELEATLHAASDMTAKETARLMGISPATVSKRLDAARCKLGVRTTRGLVLEAFRRQIIAPLAVAFLAVLIGVQHQQPTTVRRPSTPRRVEMRVASRQEAFAWAA